MPRPDPLSVLFEALADPTRRAILSHLAVGALAPQEIAAALGLSAGQVTAEVWRLESCGLVEPDPLAGGGAMRLRADGMVLAETWLAWFRRFRIDSFADLHTCLQDIAPPRARPRIAP